MNRAYEKENYALDNGLFLSPRQVAVLQELAKGLSNKQIANILNIAEPTVKMHISALLRALGAQNRVQILIKATQKGFIS